MNYDELNEYIKHYVEKDKTQSAIMLTGGWGTGKSYYIHNFLEPFLKEPENGKHRCAIVSLYGLKNTSEISKRIYFELRTIGSPKKNEAKSTAGAAATVVAKTILNGLTSKIGFDIGSISDEDFEKVYSSINLSNVLVIFEDLERSSIDIIEILGYVNSLVEQDGAKVMLVANENEILKYHDSQPDKEGKVSRIPDERTAVYLKIKEKTVSDTIIFTCDIKRAIANIIESFKNPILNNFNTGEKIKEILNIMTKLENHNLRSFIFACQKTINIYEKIAKLDETDRDFMAKIFYGIIALSLKVKNGIFPEFGHSVSLYYIKGLRSYPVYRFCYNYIRWQQFDIQDMKDDLAEQKKQLFLRKDGFTDDDDDLKVIFSYYYHFETEIIFSLKNIENRLNDPESIPIYSYSKLAYYFIKLNTIMDYDYSICKERMLNNITEKQEDIDDTNFFEDAIHFYEFESEEEKKQFVDFSEKVSQALSLVENAYKTHNFSYCPKEIEQLCYNVRNNRKKVIACHEFISQFKLNKLLEMILKCSPSELDHFRCMLLAIYREDTRGSFLDADRIFMEDLKSELENALADQSLHLDRILKLQIEYLIHNLTTFIEQFS